MDLEKYRKMRNKTLGPQAGRIETKRVSWILEKMEEGKIYVDPSYQRPKHWEGDRGESYIIGVFNSGVITAIRFVDIKSSMKACLRDFGEDFNYERWKTLLDNEFDLASLDGQSRSDDIWNFYKDKFPISRCELVAPDSDIKPLVIGEKEKYYYKDLSKSWKKRFMNKEIPVQIIEEATLEDCQFEFLNLNNTNLPNPQECRNSTPHSQVAAEVRDMAQESMMTPQRQYKQGKFYDDMKSIFSSTNLKRRGSDLIYAQGLRLTESYLDDWDNIDFGGDALDDMYYDDVITDECCLLCRHNWSQTFEIAKIIKGDGGVLSTKNVFNVFIFLLALREHGFYVNFDAESFNDFANTLDEHEGLRKVQFDIPQEKKGKKGTYSDKEWKKIKQKYSYEHWMTSSNKTSYSSLNGRLKAIKWSIEQIQGDEKYEDIFVPIPTKRKQFSINEKLEKAKEQGYKCYLTDTSFTKRDLRDGNVVMDHMMPLKHAGSNDWDNVFLVWKKVNSTKGVDIVEKVFYEEQGNEGLIEELKNKKSVRLSDVVAAIIISVCDDGVSALKVGIDKIDKYMRILHNEGVQQ